MTTYATTLEAADKLSLEEQEQLAETLRRRVTEKRRAELSKAVEAARTEHAKGRLKAASPAAIAKLIKR